MIGFHSLRDLERARTIITVFIRNGFGQILSELSLPLPLVIKKRIAVRGERLSFPERLRRVCEELGPTFVKFGQILSVRSDLLPPTYTAELSKLQDEVPPFPAEEARKVIEEELGGSLEDSFAEFDSVPVAAASMAQVHRAVLYDGRTVAVKVQRPGIRRTIRADIEILRYLASLIEERIPRARSFNPALLVEEFSRVVEKELDFIGEAQNLSRFGKNLESEKGVCCPSVCMELTTTRVLTMEWIEGRKLSEVDYGSLDGKGLARTALRSIIQQVLQNGFFHADPHPGNIVLLGDGRLAFLDLGQVGRLTKSARYRLLDLIIALDRKNYEEVTRLVLMMGEVTEPVDEEELKRDVMDIVDRYYGLALKKINASEGIRHLFELSTAYGIRLPRCYMLVGKVLITCENVGRGLDPDIDLLQEARPFVEEIALRRWMPDEVLGALVGDVKHAARLLKMFPVKAGAIMSKIERGRLAIEFKHVGIDKLVRALDRVSSRITSGLIIAALIIGSSYIISLQKGPFLLGHPLLGIIGFILAAAFGLVILISILRSGGI